VCFLNAADIDVILMKEMLQFSLFVEDSFCVPVHHFEVLLLDFPPPWLVVAIWSPLGMIEGVTPSSFGWTLSRLRARHCISLEGFQRSSTTPIDTI